MTQPRRSWILPSSAMQDSLSEIARDGMEGNEGVTLWLGRHDDGRVEVTHLVGLRGPGVVKFPDFLRIESFLFNEVADVCINLGVMLVGQIHSHGVGYSTDLSEIDQIGGVVVPYYLSVVAPDYGLRQHMSLSACGVHVFEPGIGFRRLSVREIARRIHVKQGSRPPFLLVGT